MEEYKGLEKAIELLEDIGEFKATNIDDLQGTINELETLGYDCYYNNNTDSIVWEDYSDEDSDKKYVIRTLLNGKKETVFEGTFEEAIALQDSWGTDEEDRIENIYNDIDSVLELVQVNYFGEDAKYEEVSVAEYKRVLRNE